MASLTKKSFENPDETRKPSDKTKVDVVKIGDDTIMMMTFEPGWKWSNDVKPVAGTDSCQSHHVGYVLSGKIHVVSDDGSEVDFEKDDIVDIAPGHDAWVVGDEPFRSVDFSAGETYAKKS